MEKLVDMLGQEIKVGDFVAVAARSGYGSLNYGKVTKISEVPSGWDKSSMGWSVSVKHVEREFRSGKIVVGCISSTRTPNNIIVVGQLGCLPVEVLEELN